MDSHMNTTIVQSNTSDLTLERRFFSWKKCICKSLVWCFCHYPCMFSL